MGHADHEISAAFARFDRDGNQILDHEEQERMKQELEEKRVCGLYHWFSMWGPTLHTSVTNSRVFTKRELNAPANMLYTELNEH